MPAAPQQRGGGGAPRDQLRSPPAQRWPAGQMRRNNAWLLRRRCSSQPLAPLAVAADAGRLTGSPWPALGLSALQACRIPGGLSDRAALAERPKAIAPSSRSRASSSRSSEVVGDRRRRSSSEISLGEISCGDASEMGSEVGDDGGDGSGDNRPLAATAACLATVFVPLTAPRAAPRAATATLWRRARFGALLRPGSAPMAGLVVSFFLVCSRRHSTPRCMAV